MPTCLEGFTDVIVSDKTPEEKNEIMKLLIVMISQPKSLNNFGATL